MMQNDSNVFRVFMYQKLRSINKRTDLRAGAAILIQSTERRRVSRGEFHERRGRVAAVLVQRVFRGHISRRTAGELAEQRHIQRQAEARRRSRFMPSQ